MSAQREHDKNVTVVVRSMYITKRRIVSNIFKCNLVFSSFSYLSAYKEEGSCRLFSDLNYTPKEILR